MSLLTSFLDTVCGLFVQFAICYPRLRERKDEHNGKYGLSNQVHTLIYRHIRPDKKWKYAFFCVGGPFSFLPANAIMVNELK